MNILKSVCVFSVIFLFLMISSDGIASNNVPLKVKEASPDSKLIINFDLVNLLLDASVLKMGASTRSSAKRKQPSGGTRLQQSVNLTTDNEGNKFSYEFFKSNEQRKKLNAVKSYLENLPLKTPLNLYNKREQLAYWLNLYNVTLVNEIVKIYPKRVLKSFLTGKSSIFHQKIINVAALNLSLNDIQYKILKKQYNSDALILYGLYQGIIGGPDIRKEAFTGKNVYQLLEDNAINFVNSNRGTSVNKFHNVRTSYFYQQNATYFPRFNDDLKRHLLLYANDDITDEIMLAKELKPNITNWKVNDLYGTIRTFGVGSSVTILNANLEFMSNKQLAGKLSRNQLTKLRELQTVRAKNLGGTSVTVTDLDPEDEN
ncbi:MAG: DUF547 domain-containing protein [Colwellia sp.]|nr:DUF547 domain-containing protein [Colwellia sp.]